MQVVDVSDAETQLTALLDKVERGGEVLITRLGRPIARLVPAEPGFSRAEARRAADDLREASKGVTLGGISIRELIDEGRR